MLESAQRLERRVFRSYWNDGLLDVFAATGVLLIGIGWLRDLPAVAAIVPALLVPLWAGFRQKLIEPRMGHVEFTEDRERLNRRRLQIVAYTGIAALILAVEGYFFREHFATLPLAEWIAGLPALLLAMLAVVVALLTGSTRFVVYALLLAAAGWFGALAGWVPGATLVLAGAGMLVIAAAVMIHFFVHNPIVTEGES